MKTKVFILGLLLTVAQTNSVNAQVWGGFGNGLSSNPVNSVVVYNNDLYAASSGVYFWNGSQWINKSDGMIFIMDVYSLAVYNNTLFAGGFFTVLTPEGNWYNNVARFNNGAWATCGSGTGNDGSGMDDYVNFLIEFNGELYAGGRFGTAGGDPLYPQEVGYIARFNGTQWNPVGGGMDFTVTDLVIFNGELIASGYFTMAGGISANYIAKWNGANWSPLGSGMDGKVTALAVYNGELYAGGLFDHAGGIAAKSIAKWNGQSWSPVGNGISGGAQVYTLASYNNELYAGGKFTSNGGNAGDYIMRWDGTQWKSVGSGTDGPVLCLLPNNLDLIVGGQFSNAGGISANNIAKLSFTTDVRGENNYIPSEFSLSQNYPNPFNPTTVIRYSIPNVISTEGRNLNVVLKVYDVLGNEIATLVNEEKSAGRYEIEFNAAGLASGVYYYQLRSNNFVEIKKMILLK